MRLAIRRLRFPVALGLLVAALTVATFLSRTVSGYVERVPVLSTPLELGIIVAMIPFGGIHDATLPEWATITWGALVNGALWFVVGRALLSLYRGIRRARGSAIGDHVT